MHAVPIGRVIVRVDPCICVRIHQEGAYGFACEDGVYEIIDRCHLLLFGVDHYLSVQLRKRLVLGLVAIAVDSVKRSRPALSVFKDDHFTPEAVRVV
jgi:hypothetical protein